MSDDGGPPIGSWASSVYELLKRILPTTAASALGLVVLLTTNLFDWLGDVPPMREWGTGDLLNFGGLIAIGFLFASFLIVVAVSIPSYRIRRLCAAKLSRMASKYVSDIEGLNPIGILVGVMPNDERGAGWKKILLDNTEQISEQVESFKNRTRKLPKLIGREKASDYVLSFIEIADGVHVVDTIMGLAMIEIKHGGLKSSIGTTESEKIASFYKITKSFLEESNDAIEEYEFWMKH